MGCKGSNLTAETSKVSPTSRLHHEPETARGTTYTPILESVCLPVLVIPAACKKQLDLSISELGKDFRQGHQIMSSISQYSRQKAKLESNMNLLHNLEPCEAEALSLCSIEKRLKVSQLGQNSGQRPTRQKLASTDQVPVSHSKYSNHQEYKDRTSVVGRNNRDPSKKKTLGIISKVVSHSTAERADSQADKLGCEATLRFPEANPRFRKLFSAGQIEEEAPPVNQPESHNSPDPVQQLPVPGLRTSQPVRLQPPARKHHRFSSMAVQRVIDT